MTTGALGSTRGRTSTLAPSHDHRRLLLPRLQARDQQQRLPGLLLLILLTCLPLGAFGATRATTATVSSALGPLRRRLLLGPAAWYVCR